MSTDGGAEVVCERVDASDGRFAQFIAAVCASSCVVDATDEVGPPRCLGILDTEACEPGSHVKVDEERSHVRGTEINRKPERPGLKRRTGNDLRTAKNDRYLSARGSQLTR